MDAAFKGSIADSSAGHGFRVVTRPLGRFVPSDAGHGNFDLALGMGELFYFDDFHRNVPRSNGFKVFIFGNDANRVVALGLAGMLAVGGVVGKVANLLTWWTVALVAVMRICVVAFGMDPTR